MEGICGWCVYHIRSRGWNCSHHPRRIKLEHSFRLGFKASNNKAENEALLIRLKIFLDLGSRGLLGLSVDGQSSARELQGQGSMDDGVLTVGETNHGPLSEC